MDKHVGHVEDLEGIFFQVGKVWILDLEAVGVSNLDFGFHEIGRVDFGQRDFSHVQEVQLQVGTFCKKWKEICVINDLLGQINSPTRSDYYFQATVVLFCDIFGRTDGQHL